MNTLLLISLTLLGANVQKSSTDKSRPDLRCGSYCLYVGLRALDIPIPSFDDLEAKLGQPGRLGYSMKALADSARTYHAHATGVETSLDWLKMRPNRFVCIALLDEGRFANIYNIENNNVYIVDPPRNRVIPEALFLQQWSGKALLISNQPILTESELKHLYFKSMILKCIGILTFSVAIVFAGVYYVRRFKFSLR